MHARSHTYTHLWVEFCIMAAFHHFTLHLQVLICGSFFVSLIVQQDCEIQIDQGVTAVKDRHRTVYMGLRTIRQ